MPCRLHRSGAADRQALRRDASRDEVASRCFCALARDREGSLGVAASVGVTLEPQLEDVGVFDEDLGQRVEIGDGVVVVVVAEAAIPIFEPVQVLGCSMAAVHVVEDPVRVMVEVGQPSVS